MSAKFVMLANPHNNNPVLVNSDHVRTASESAPNVVTLVMDGGLHQNVDRAALARLGRVLADALANTPWSRDRSTSSTACAKLGCRKNQRGPLWVNGRTPRYRSCKVKPRGAGT